MPGQVKSKVSSCHLLLGLNLIAIFFGSGDLTHEKPRVISVLHSTTIMLAVNLPQKFCRQTFFGYAFRGRDLIQHVQCPEQKYIDHSVLYRFISVDIKFPGNAEVRFKFFKITRLARCNGCIGKSFHAMIKFTGIVRVVG